MRILLISDHADPLADIGSKESGGQNVYVYSLAKHLSMSGHQVDVMTRLDDPAKATIQTVMPGFRVIRIQAGPIGYMPRDNFINVINEFVTNAYQFINSRLFTYDFIHTNYWYSGLIGLHLRHKIKAPMAHVFHSIGQVRLDALSKYQPETVDTALFQLRYTMEKMIASLSDGIIATSPIERDTILEIFGIDPFKITVIPVGVDQDIFKPGSTIQARRELDLPLDQPILTYAGRLEFRKGISTLLGAMTQIRQTYPGVVLQIVGGGHDSTPENDKEMSRLALLASKLGITDNIRFVGGKSQDNIKPYYDAADTVVTPSYYEPFGIVPLEAMACGKPVVATTTGGFLYTIKPGITGELAKPHSETELAERILAVLANGSAHYRNNCIAHIYNNFRWSKVTELTTNYIKENFTHEDSPLGSSRRIGTT